MRQLFTCLSAVCLGFSAHAQTTPSVASATAVQTSTVTTNVTSNTISIVQADEMLSLKEIEFDFGKIPQGKPVTHVFEVINKSNLPLKITQVNASCGCTTPTWEKDKTVASGEKTNVTVGYNAAAEGPFTKFITVTYNDTQSKQITIKGEVWKTPGSSAPENKGLNDLKN